MPKTVDYRAKMQTTRPSREIDDLLRQCKSSLTQRVPEIDSISTRVELQDQTQTVGSGLKIVVTGRIVFKALEPPIQTLVNAGAEAFGHDFDLRPMIELFPTDKTSTSAPIMCRSCRSQIGEVQDFIRLQCSGNEAQIGQTVRSVGIAHIRSVHPDVDPSTVAYL